MDKVVMMSRLFGVSTDFLLKDELEEETPCAAAQDDDTPLRRVTMKQASAYLALRKAAAPKIAIATALCIISPVTLILLAGMSEVQRFHITENAASGIGLCVLLGLVALAVSIFLRTGAEAKEYRFLEEEPSRRSTAWRAWCASGSGNTRTPIPGSSPWAWCCVCWPPYRCSPPCA